MTFRQHMEWDGVKILKDDYVQWRSCTRKKRYSKLSDAEFVAKKCGGRAYFCENEGCGGGFHVTSDRPKKAKQP